MTVQYHVTITPIYIAGLHISPLSVSPDALSQCKMNPHLRPWTESLTRAFPYRLLQLSVSQSLNDPGATTLIRACTLGNSSVPVPKNDTIIDNPKKEIALASARLNSEPACLSDGVATEAKVQSFFGGNEKELGNSAHATALLRGIQDFFGAKDNCDEQFVFAYYNETVAGAYIGSQLGKGTVPSSLQGFIDQYQEQSSPSQAVVEYCQAGSANPEYVFGVTIKNASNLASVQDTVKEWSKGNCFLGEGFTSAGSLPSAVVFQIPSNTTLGGNTTLSGNTTSAHHRRGSHAAAHLSKRHYSVRGHHLHIEKRATCSSIAFIPGDTCPSLAKRCGITAPNFAKYNQKQNLCSTLKDGDVFCCSAGDLPSAGVAPPTAGSDGVCATHLIQNGDTCSSLATRYGVTADDLEKWNKGKTWAWTECKDMLLGYNLCVSDGFAPMPPPQQGVSTSGQIESDTWEEVG
jgi:hypothetical protein